MGVYDHMFLIPREDYHQTHMPYLKQKERNLSGEVHGSQVNNIEVSRGGTLLIQTDGDLAGNLPTASPVSAADVGEKTNDGSAKEFLSDGEEGGSHTRRRLKKSGEQTETAGEDRASRSRKKRGELKYAPDDQVSAPREKSGAYSTFRKQRSPSPLVPHQQFSRKRRHESEQEANWKRGRAHVAERLAQLEGRTTVSPNYDDGDVEMTDMQTQADAKIRKRGMKDGIADVEMREVKSRRKQEKVGKPSILISPPSSTKAGRKVDVEEDIIIPSSSSDSKVRIRLRKADPSVNKPPAIEIVPPSPTKLNEREVEGDYAYSKFPPSQLRIKIGEPSGQTKVSDDTITFDGGRRTKHTVGGESGKKINQRELQTTRKEKRRVLGEEKRKMERDRVLGLARRINRGEKRASYPLWEKELQETKSRPRTRPPPPSITISPPSPTRSSSPLRHSAPAYDRPYRPLRIKVQYRGKKRARAPLPLWEEEEETEIPYKRKLLTAKRRNLKRAAPNYESVEQEEEETNLPYKRRLLSNEVEEDEYSMWEEE